MRDPSQAGSSSVPANKTAPIRSDHPFGTAMFDLANLAAANSFDSDLETKMLAHYFERAPNDAITRAFSAMKVAAALREAIWGMISELFLNAPGADYIAYAAEYLSRFETILKTHENKFGKS